MRSRSQLPTVDLGAKGSAGTWGSRGRNGLAALESRMNKNRCARLATQAGDRFVTGEIAIIDFLSALDRAASRLTAASLGLPQD